METAKLTKNYKCCEMNLLLKGLILLQSLQVATFNGNNENETTEFETHNDA